MWLHGVCQYLKNVKCDELLHRHYSILISGGYIFCWLCKSRGSTRRVIKLFSWQQCTVVIVKWQKYLSSPSLLLELNLPPLQTPLGSVTHPQPCPHGKAQVNDPRGLSSWWDFRSTATAALPRTSAAAWLTLSLCDLRADTSELVGAVGVIERDKGRLVWVSGNVKSNFIVITVRGSLSFCSGVSYRESIVKVDRSAKGQPEFRISNLFRSN